MRGVIYCLCGPSGSGKTTLANSCGIPRVTTVTTRSPREGEVDGFDYYFWGEEIFRRGIEDQMFFEYEEVHGKFYGTLKGSLEEVIARNGTAVIILDVKGAMTLKETYPLNSVNVFLTCTNKGELRRRIEARKTSQEEVERRLKNATEELRAYSLNHEKFDYLILNDDLNTSKSSLLNITLHQGVKLGRPLVFKDETYV